jgi:hypothetical protein
VRGLYKGAWALYLRLAPHSVITLVTFEFFGDFGCGVGIGFVGGRGDGEVVRGGGFGEVDLFFHLRAVRGWEFGRGGGCGKWFGGGGSGNGHCWLLRLVKAAGRRGPA